MDSSSTSVYLEPQPVSNPDAYVTVTFCFPSFLCCPCLGFYPSSTVIPQVMDFEIGSLDCKSLDLAEDAKKLQFQLSTTEVCTSL